MRSQGWGNDTTGVEDDVAGVGDDGRGGGMTQMGLRSGGSAAHEETKRIHRTERGCGRC